MKSNNKRNNAIWFPIEKKFQSESCQIMTMKWEFRFQFNVNIPYKTFDIVHVKQVSGIFYRSLKQKYSLIGWIFCSYRVETIFAVLLVVKNELKWKGMLLHFPQFQMNHMLQNLIFCSKWEFLRRARWMDHQLCRISLIIVAVPKQTFRVIFPVKGLTQT